MLVVNNYYRYLALIFTDVLCIKAALLGLLSLLFTVASESCSCACAKDANSTRWVRLV